MKTMWLRFVERAKHRGGFKRPIVSAIVAKSIVALMATTGFAAAPDSGSAALEPERVRAAGLLRAALDEGGSPIGAGQGASLIAAARRAAELLGEESLVAQELLGAAERSEKENATSAALREALEEARRKLTFQPLMEADLPRGFPKAGPLGEIRVKEYPTYRMAVSKSGGSAFWTLFQHIKRNQIAMTAPVEMEYGNAVSEDLSEQSMAFLYGDPELGRPGTDGAVEVVDAPPLTVVSLGLNGRRSDDKIDRARDRLLAWLADESRYEAAGPLRVLGYNSPFVPRDRQFWEVQIPIRDVRQVDGKPATGKAS